MKSNLNHLLMPSKLELDQISPRLEVQLGSLLMVYNILIKPPHLDQLWKGKDRLILWRLWQIIFVYRSRKV